MTTAQQLPGERPPSPSIARPAGAPSTKAPSTEALSTEALSTLDGQASSARRTWGGLAVAVLSAATFGTSGTLGTSLLDAGWSPATAVLARIAVAALMLTAPAALALRGRWRRLWRSWRVLVAYGVIGVVACQVCYFNAIEQMPVGIALLIEYTGSILVVGWLWLRHGQRPRRLTILGAAAAIGGLTLMVAIGGSGDGSAAGHSGVSPVGLAWALMAAVSMAVYFMLSAGPVRPRAAGEPAAPEPLPPIALAWAAMWVGAAFLALALAVGALPLHASASDVTLLRHQVPVWLPIAGIALLSTATGYSAGIIAARRLGPKLASFIGMAEILFAVIYAWILLGQLPSATQFGGGALILAGVALVRIDES
ncbi:MAG TPA: EamA family transporter [Trebonia sp.]|nr:EamA family transporter [Trebonia sp.]